MISANQNLRYIIALLLSRETKKTCAALARTVEVKDHVMWKSLHNNMSVKNELKSFAHQIFDKNKILYLIIDDTTIAKIYSKYIEGTSDNRNSSKSSMEWGLCSVVAMITDGKIAIPVSLRNWQQEEIAQENYQSKVELAKELILEVTQVLTIGIIVMDGLYARQEMIKWLNANNLKFEMRMHANRVVKSEDGESAQLRNHSKLQLKGRQHFKAIHVAWENI